MEGTKDNKTSKVALLEFYDALEKRIKRHRPIDYITWMSKRLEESWTDTEKFVQIPPHRIMHSIEANCAYWKEGYSEPVSWDAIAKIMNTYNDFVDPFQLGTISENADRFFLMIYREQIELQKRVSWAYIMRVWRLFVRSPYMKRSNENFISKFGLTMDKWVKLCFLCWVIAIKESGNPFLIKNIPDPETGIGRKEFDVFMKNSARSVKDIGENFHKIREEVPYELHSLIRSAFMETPIIKFEDERMIVPHTHLMFRHSGEGLYRLAKDLNEFDDEFSDSFESYIQKLLESMRGNTNIISSKKIKKVAKTKSCDFIVETKDTLILIECKACSFTAKHFSDDAIINTNSTGKVAKGINQLYASAKDLEEGMFEKFNINNKKPTVGIVVTFGEIPSANSDWFFEEFFLKRAKDKLNQNIYPSNQMIRRPIVLDISTIEKLIVFLNSQPKKLYELYDERKDQGYGVTGDWGVWLSSQGKAQDNINSKLLSFLKNDRVDFLGELGIPAEAFPD